VIQVNDGLPGLPESMNGRRLPGGTAFEVRGDRLWVSAAPESPYVDTGDLVPGRTACAARCWGRWSPRTSWYAAMPSPAC
jgi:hypothetical protein